ncbi:MAG: peptidase C14, caspase catalytic subunit p20, partial [Moorea sp. SIO2B7]|nr:peptidase C14, caspase catalytic subunit p20 [Moorena sp. SIO2B7]
PVGTVEVLVIASASPLRKSLKVLQKIATMVGTSKGPISVENDDLEEIVDNFLGDINRGTRGGLGASYSPNTRAVDTEMLGAMSITFRGI